MISKEALLKGSLPERVVPIPGKGDVRVRGLSRAEAVAAGGLARGGDLDASEASILAAGLVDPPVTAGEAGEWRRSSLSGELDLVLDAIAELSATHPGALGEAVRQFRGGPGDGVGVPPGPDPGDDGEPPT